jgi:uncharacterized membrane protein
MGEHDAAMDDRRGTLPGPMRGMSARTQVSVAGAVGVAVALAVSILVGPRFGALVGWDAATALYMAWVWLKVWPLDSEHTREAAEHEDPTRAGADLILLCAAVVSLVAVALVLASAAKTSGTAESLRVGLGLASVVVSWGLVHTVYTLRYARLYYAGADGGVDFNEPTPPAYRDFAYLSFTIGMTFQVSDTAISDREVRATALRHGLLSFVFATGIIATTINLVASLTSR